MKLHNIQRIHEDSVRLAGYLIVTAIMAQVTMQAPYSSVETPNRQHSLETAVTRFREPNIERTSEKSPASLGQKMTSQRIKFFQQYADDVKHLGNNSGRKQQKYDRRKRILPQDYSPYLLPVKPKSGEGQREALSIDCPFAEDGIKLFACPSPDSSGGYKCIDDYALCDNTVHCPLGEDEDPTICMFHTMTMNYFRILLDAVFGMTRSVI